jgi:hypothetical protein
MTPYFNVSYAEEKFERQKRFYGAETITMQQAAAGDFKN